jgi:hypothetical protein
VGSDPVSWDDAVARLDATDRRALERITLDLVCAADAVHTIGGSGHPLERRRLAGLAARHALAAYRLAGGGAEHFRDVMGLGSLIGHPDDVARSVGGRAVIARARVELATRTDIDDRVRARAAAALDDAAAYAERTTPRPVDDQHRTTTTAPDVDDPVRDLARTLGVDLNPLPPARP